MSFLFWLIGILATAVYLFGVGMIWFEETTIFGATNREAIVDGLRWPYDAIRSHFAR